MSSDRNRILVVGGTGYVGGRIAEHLHSKGWSVGVTGRRVALSNQLAGTTLDILQDSDGRLDEVLIGVDAIVNCVALNERNAQESPDRARELAVTAATRLLDAAERHGINLLLHLSTVRVYGRLDGYLDEESPVSPVHPYAEAHAQAESVLLGALPDGVDVVIMRVSNAVGPPVRAEVDRWALVTNELARQWAEDGRLVLRTAGMEMRDFVALSDVARAVNHLLMWSGDLPRVVNVCSGRARSIFEIAERMAELAESIRGVRPLVEHPEPAIDAGATGTLRISNVLLGATTGFEYFNRIDDELAGLLRFCVRAFSGRSISQ